MALHKTILFFSVIMILYGCASQDTYQAALRSWIGSNKSELMKSWGQPAKSYSQGSSTYLIYNKSGPSSGDMGFKEQVIEIGSCTTTFQVVDDIVISSSFEGQNCRARTALP